MKPVPGKRICKLLEERGWMLDRVNGSHHVYSKPGSPPIVVPVHGNRDLPSGTQRALMRQTGLTDADL